MNNWYHLALTVTNDNQFISYVNGSVSKTGSLTQNVRTTFIQNTIGGGWYAMLGMVQDVMWFPAQLTAAEIHTLYTYKNLAIQCLYGPVSATMGSVQHHKRMSYSF